MPRSYPVLDDSPEIIVTEKPELEGAIESQAWLGCMQAAAVACSGMRSANTIATLADELYTEWLERASAGMVG